jgi:hypothetical protein
LIKGSLGWVLILWALLLGLSSCNRGQYPLPTSMPSIIPKDTSTSTNVPDSPEIPTRIATTQPFELELAPVVLAAQEFFDLIRRGEIDKALSYWDLHADDASNFERIVREWHTQGFDFAIGQVNYSGFVADGDFQDLEADDPRASIASLEVSIGGKPYYLMFAKFNNDWRMNGLLVRESEN